MDELEVWVEDRRRSLVRCAWAVSVAISMVGRSAVAIEPEADAVELSRVVSIGGAVTEILFALGIGPSVVAVDTSSVFPDEATKLPQVGYQRALSAEGILSLRPSVVIATEESGPPPVLAQLRSAGVPVITIPAPATIAGVRQKIELVAAAVRQPARGAALVKSLDEALASAADRAATVGKPARVLFVYARGAGTLNVSGTGTAAELLIELAGGRNAITSFDGFRPLTSEAVVAAEPDVILFTSRGLESLGGKEGVLRVPGVSLTPAGKNGRVIALDDLMLLGLGPRTGQAVAELANLIYPAVTAPAGEGR